jgi:hypothetical protein
VGARGGVPSCLPKAFWYCRYGPVMVWGRFALVNEGISVGTHGGRLPHLADLLGGDLVVHPASQTCLAGA